ncbi:metallophosphoesterase [Lewinella sp. IMCC34183]|uniref:metallophosphoesterase n=1 Tax=Lewinella sp. IMCC34183 TaxID=2248762 RepID=UPI000E289AEB|nr:metallophosphoesterase [Lewinella sp. IMCC34183]
MPYDFIGDIHGHADALEQLLRRLDYRPDGDGYRHPARRAFFVGDFIDRGPDSPGVLRTVRAMVESGAARAVMGNHEYNAILYHTPRPDGNGYLRPHSAKNHAQHAATLEQFRDRPAELADYLRWFRTLPLYYEETDFRAVHACWHPLSIGRLRERLPDDRLPDPVPPELEALETPFARAIDRVLKGPEFDLPHGHSFLDKDGHRRLALRNKWWRDPRGATYGDLSVHGTGPELESLLYTGEDTDYYGVTEKHVFFGHYWLRGTPTLFRHNVCCLDYSVARDGQLVAYRFDGEKELEVNKLVAV